VPLGITGLAMSDHVLAIRYVNALAGLETTDLWRLDTSGQWVRGGVVPFGRSDVRHTEMTVTDTELVYGNSYPDASSDGVVLIIPVVLTPTSVSADIFSPAVRFALPDPGWSMTDRAGFGREIALDGDLLAVSSGNDHVQVYRRTGADWPLDVTLTNPGAPANNGRFGSSIAVDTSTGTGRLLVGEQGGLRIGGPIEPGRAVLYERGSAGWSETKVIEPRAGSAYDGLGLGAEVTLDGAWATVGYHWAQLATGGGALDEYRLDVYSVGTDVTFEAELSALAAVGGAQAGDTSAVVAFPVQSGSHLSAVVWQNAGSEVRFSAVSWDRHPGG
jgi:hypothetical protein